MLLLLALFMLILLWLVSPSVSGRWNQTLNLRIVSQKTCNSATTGAVLKQDDLVAICFPVPTASAIKPSILGLWVNGSSIVLVQDDFWCYFAFLLVPTAAGIKSSILESRVNESTVVLLTLALFEVDFTAVIFLFPNANCGWNQTLNLKIVSQYIYHSAPVQALFKVDFAVAIFLFTQCPTVSGIKPTILGLWILLLLFFFPQCQWPLESNPQS